MRVKAFGYLTFGLIMICAFTLSGSHSQPGVPSPPPAIIVTSPNGGEAWAAGSIQTITWRYEGIRAGDIIGQVTIELRKRGRSYSVITHSASPGAGASGSFRWEIPLLQAPGNDYRVQVLAHRFPPEDPVTPVGMTDDSDGDFAIPTSGKIAFVSQADSSTRGDIFVIDEAGVQRLTSDSADDVSPAWSPRWDKIAFVSRRDGNFEIYVMNADGSQLKNITSTTAPDWDPSWSPRRPPQLIPPLVDPSRLRKKIKRG